MRAGAPVWVLYCQVLRMLPASRAESADFCLLCLDGKGGNAGSLDAATRQRIIERCARLTPPQKHHHHHRHHTHTNTQRRRLCRCDLRWRGGHSLFLSAFYRLGA